MHIKMTGETFGETFMDLLFVRSAVALGALRHKAVLGMMTGSTVDLAMLARGSLPLGIDPAVTGTAGDGRSIFFVGDLQGLVHRMTFGAGRQLLSRVMRLVAGEAGRLEPM